MLGLQKSLEEIEKNQKKLTEEQERVQLENLRLMLHFKTETRDVSNVFDSVVTAIEQMNESPYEAHKVLSATRTVLGATSVRIREEISSLQRVIEGVATGEEGGLKISHLLDDNSKLAI